MSTVTNNSDMQVEDTMTEDESTETVEETVEGKVGSLVGNCKWFNNRLGYGFVTVCSDGEHKGKDIFCHHSGVHPINSKFRTLIKGEYINFDIEEGQNGPQAVNITGILGGALMCDNNISYSVAGQNGGSPEMNGYHGQSNASHMPPPPTFGGGMGMSNVYKGGRGAGRGNGGGGRGVGSSGGSYSITHGFVPGEQRKNNTFGNPTIRKPKPVTEKKE